ncbi:hypothetical protein [Halobellus limi]|uniref:Uncharacterized protein n=1 Tax=Halobellus limi TaxID=699433 RepID=A0A4D6H7L6_9EURY|nr:hypothetical protein [Halobellus limi]QCC49152.1 hypothetical protein DV707_15470 [Halobellus limi]
MTEAVGRGFVNGIDTAGAGYRHRVTSDRENRDAPAVRSAEAPRVADSSGGTPSATGSNHVVRP